MTKNTSQSEKIQNFIIQNVSSHPDTISNLVANEFNISRQAVNRHLNQLIGLGVVESSGKTKNKRYTLKPLTDTRFDFKIKEGLEEDAVWRNTVRPNLDNIPQNVLNICQYGFTEMVNNVIDHSNGTSLTILLNRDAVNLKFTIIDNGIGIFQKIQTELELENHFHVILELAKGKVTTDPERHTGEGIFFTSKMFDKFVISSGNLIFGHTESGGDWLLEEDVKSTVKGTAIRMDINIHSSRTSEEVFEAYTSEYDEFGFTKTIVPVKLAKYGDEQLISRSQAKRLLARFDRFRVVLLDFKDVPSIGQAFVDEIFRVFRKNHPEIEINWLNANAQIEKMIKHALMNGEIG